MQQKIKWIDNVKGLTIFAVVLGHIATPFTDFIFSWHVPAFFFLSGFFINFERPMKESIKKESRRLFVPFFIFGILGLIAEIIKRNLFPGFEFVFQDFSVVKEIQGLFFWMDFTHMHQYGFILWFLAALFWGKLILQFLLKFIKNKIAIGIICLIIFFALANRGFIFPFSIDKGLLSLAWMFGGYFYYNYFIKGKKESRMDLYAIIFAIGVFFTFSLPSIDIASKIVQTPLISLLYSFSIIFLITIIFKNFGDKYLNNSFLENWGKNSLNILVMHPYTNNVGYIIGNKFFNGNWIVILIVSVIILIISLLIIKYAGKIIRNSRFADRFQSSRADQEGS